MKTAKKNGTNNGLIIVLGVIILGLAFVGGYSFLGPRLNMNSPVSTQSTQAPAYVPPTAPQHEPAPNSMAGEQSQLDVQITDHSNAGSQSRQSIPNNGIQHDQSGLTLTLDPTDSGDSANGNVQVSVSHSRAGRMQQTEPKTSVGGLEQSRAATESHTAPKGLFRVQAGTFADRAHADALASDLKAHGYGAHIKMVQSDRGTLYRVQVGAYGSKSDADTMMNDLSTHGYTPGMIADRGSER